MIKVYNIGLYLAIGRRLAVPILVASNLFFAYSWATTETKKIAPVSHFINAKGEVQTSVCYPEAKLNENVAFDLIKNLGQVMFAYDKGKFKDYAQKYSAFKPWLDPRSKAAAKVRRTVEANLGDTERRSGPIFAESAAFELDRSKFVIRKSKTEAKTWNAIVSGKQTFIGEGGNTSKEISLNLTLIEGDDNAVFVLSDLPDFQ